MCIHTLRATIRKKKSSRGMRDSSERPKIRHKGYTTKTNKDLGMSC